MLTAGYVIVPTCLVLVIVATVLNFVVQMTDKPLPHQVRVFLTSTMIAGGVLGLIGIGMVIFSSGS